MKTRENFAPLGLSEKTLAPLEKKGFEEPSEIQALTIPLMLTSDVDVIAQAQTGTGKTAAFALPLIEKLENGKHVEAIILAPTRELVIQICEEFSSLKGNSPLTIASVYGGQSIGRQLTQLRRGVSVVVGTPGRILDHIRRKSLNLSKIRYFILDEADEMLNMGFIEDIETIMDQTPEQKRVLLFSATMPARIKALAQKYMGKYTHVKTKTALTTSLTDQIYFEVSHRDKFDALCRIIDIEENFYGIVFCRTKLDVAELAKKLQDRGLPSDGLHGDISQVQREQILGKFRKKSITILAATDVAARGIDVSNLTHVINYSIPQNPEAYIHRIGRTGRAGNQGTAVTFITPSEMRKLGFIKRAANVDIRRERLPEADDIIRVKKEKIGRDVAKVLENSDLSQYREWAKELSRGRSDLDIAAAVLRVAFGDKVQGSSYKVLSKPRAKTAATPPTRSRGRTAVEEEGHTRLFIAKGKESGMTAKSLVEFIVQTAGTDQKFIGSIEILDRFSFVSVPFAEAEIILEKFRGRAGRHKSVVTMAREKDADGKTPSRRSESQRAGKRPYHKRTGAPGGPRAGGPGKRSSSPVRKKRVKKKNRNK